MNAIQTLHLINTEVRAQLAKINNLTLTAWICLARELEVEANNREFAAKKLALRKLRADGKLAK